jgi:hypothetical protein
MFTACVCTLSIILYLSFTYLTLCLFLLFSAAVKQQNKSIVKFVRSLPFWKCWNFGRFLRFPYTLEARHDLIGRNRLNG